MQEITLIQILMLMIGAIVIMLIVLAGILSANLRQIKSINSKLETTLDKAENYFAYILEDEADVPVESVEESEREEKIKRENRDAKLIQEVLMEYFPG